MAKAHQDRAAQARWVAVLALAAGALYLCWQMLQPFVGVLITAVVLALVFAPLHALVERKVRRPWLAALLTTGVVVVILILPLLIVSGVVLKQLPTAIALARDGAVTLLARLEESERLRPYVADLKQRFDLETVLRADGAQELLGTWGKAALRGTMTALGGVLGFGVDVLFALFTMYYLFRDGAQLKTWFLGLLPFEQSQTEELTQRACLVIRASVSGVLVIAVVQGTLGGIAFWMLGVAAPITWAVVMTIAAIIPVVGSVIIWAPAALYLLVTGHPIKAMILTAWGALVIGMADNLLRPRLVGRKTDMHELLVFFSVLGGIQAFGAFGFLLGPSLLAVTLAMIEMLELTRRAPVLPPRDDA